MLDDFASITLTRAPSTPLANFNPAALLADIAAPPTTGLPLGGRRWRARWRAAGRPAWRIRRAARKLRAGWTHEGVAEYRSERQVAVDFERDAPEYCAAAAMFGSGWRPVSVVVGSVRGGAR